MSRKAVQCIILILSLSFGSTQFISAGSPDKIFKVRKEDSHIGFSIYKWLVIKEEGRFKDFNGTIRYDESNPRATQVEFTIQTASVDSRNENRDGAIRGEEFLNVKQYPTMTFKSTNAWMKGKDSLFADGDITIRGVTKRITIPVKVTGVANAGREIGTVAGFESTFAINREDFGVARGWDVIGKDVTINLLIGAGSK